MNTLEERGPVRSQGCESLTGTPVVHYKKWVFPQTMMLFDAKINLARKASFDTGCSAIKPLMITHRKQVSPPPHTSVSTWTISSANVRGPIRDGSLQSLGQE